MCEVGKTLILSGLLAKFLCFDIPKYTPLSPRKRGEGTFGYMPQVLYTLNFWRVNHLVPCAKLIAVVKTIQIALIWYYLLRL